MLDTLKEILIALTFAGVCAIGAYLLKNKKQNILSVITDLVQKAEAAIQGSGMGAEKKAKVIAQLEAMGITVTSWLDKQIDNVVALLNEKSGWFAGSATEQAEEVIDELVADIKAGGSE